MDNDTRRLILGAVYLTLALALLLSAAGAAWDGRGAEACLFALVGTLALLGVFDAWL